MQPNIEADPCDYYIDLDFLFEPEILFDYSDPAAQVSDTEIERSFQSERDPIGRQFFYRFKVHNGNKRFVQNTTYCSEY